MKCNAMSGRHLVSKPLWIADPQFMDLKSSMRLDFHQHHDTTNEEKKLYKLKAKNCKPKVSAYRSTLTLNTEPTSKIPTLMTRNYSEVYQDNEDVPYLILNQKPKSKWLVDDFNSNRRGWLNRGHVFNDHLPMSEASVYREHYAHKHGGQMKLYRPVHIPLKTAEKFNNTSLYKDEFIPKQMVIRRNPTRTPLGLNCAQVARNKSSFDWRLNQAENLEPVEYKIKPHSIYRTDFKQPKIETNVVPVRKYRKLEDKSKLSTVVVPPFEILDPIPNIKSSYRSAYCNSSNLSSTVNITPAGLTSLYGPIKSQAETYPFIPNARLVKQLPSKQSTSKNNLELPVIDEQKLTQIIENISRTKNEWPYLEHQKGLFYTTK